MNKAAKNLTHLFVSATAAALIGCGGGAETNTQPSKVDPTQPVSDWTMVWSDEFDGDSIDTQKWNHEVNCDGGGNNEKQCYTDNAENSYVQDGILHIVALPAEEGASLPYTSARLTSKHKGDFKYGRFEIRAKLPSGQGSWPAAWMLPTDEFYGGWPKSGEIDIMEAVNLGTVDAEGNVETLVHGTLHYGRDWPNNESSGKSYQLPGGDNPADDFHTYAIEWQEGEIRWYVDDYLYQTQRASQLRYNSKGEVVGMSHQGWFSEYFDQGTGELTTHWDNSPYDQRFHLLLNFAVGGAWPENVNNLGIDAQAFASGQHYEIDYVRVYECRIDSDSGKGCETVRGGYDKEESDDFPNGALVLGKAPTPPKDTSDVPANLPDLVVFENEDTQFLAGHWAASGDVTVEDVDLGDARGIVKQFTFNADEAVAYFQSTDTTDISAYTYLEFDVYLVNDNGAPDFTIKMDCVHPCSSGDYPVEKPMQGEWKSYKILLADLVANEGSSLDLSKVNTPLVFFPTWGNMNGFSVQIDNVRLTTPPATTELDVFIDQDTEFVAGYWAASGDVGIDDVDLGGEHGIVKQFTFNSNEAVAYFQSTDTHDVSAYTTLDFDVFVVTDNGADDFIIKMDCVHPCSSGDYPVAKPAEGVWTSYSIPLLDLVEHEGSVLDLTLVNTPLVFFPTWGNMEGFVIQIDNVRFSQNPALDVFKDKDTDFLAGYWAASGDVSIEEVNLGGEHGAVKQFSFNTDEAVAYFQSTDTHDVSDFTMLEFDVFVVNDNGASDFIIKMDCVHPCSSGDFPIAKPAEGVWTTYRIPLVDLVNNEGSVLDLSIVNTPLVFFPTWGNMNGFVVQIDNVRFTKTPILDVYVNEDTDFLAGHWAASGDVGIEEVNVGGAHGKVKQFAFNTDEAVAYFQSTDTADVSEFTRLDFDVFVVTDNGASDFIIKMDCVHPCSSGDYPVAKPAQGVWTSYSIPLADLVNHDGSVLDLTIVNTPLVFFPTWGNMNGFVAQIDNVRFK